MHSNYLEKKNDLQKQLKIMRKNKFTPKTTFNLLKWPNIVLYIFGLSTTFNLVSDALPLVE